MRCVAGVSLLQRARIWCRRPQCASGLKAFRNSVESAGAGATEERAVQNFSNAANSSSSDRVAKSAQSQLATRPKFASCATVICLGAASHLVWPSGLGQQLLLEVGGQRQPSSHGGAREKRTVGAAGKRGQERARGGAGAGERPRPSVSQYIIQ